MSASKEVAEEVLRLDAAATPGPWEAEGDAIFDRSGDGVCEVRAWSSTSWRRTRVADEANASLIAAYRTAAPDLAREVQRLRALVDVPYRPGLPSVEQVRAHEERCPGAGGWTTWQRHRAGTAANIVLLVAVAGAIWVADGGSRRRLTASACQWRPCLPDGTPCPWGDQ